jgi:membrane protein implicated in regulation of membrane protease activity
VRKIVRWEPPARAVPRRPYRDSIVLYGALAILLVAVAAATGGSVLRAVVIGVLFFVAATAWSWRRWRERLREEERRRT